MDHAYRRYRGPIAIAVAIALMVICGGVVMDYQRTKSHQLALKEAADLNVNVILKQLIERLDNQLFAADGLAHTLKEHGSFAVQSIDEPVRHELERSPALLAVVIAPNNQLARLITRTTAIGDGTHPLNGTVAGINVDNLARQLRDFDASDRSLLVESAEDTTLTLAVPLTDAKGRDWGTLALLIDEHQFLLDAGISPSTSTMNIQETTKTGWMHVSIQHLGSTGTTRLTGTDLSDLAPIVSSIPVPGGAWEIAAAPHGGWDAAPDDQGSFRLLLAFGGFATIIPVFVASVLVAERNRHITMLKSRESKLVELSQRFSLAMETSNIGIWEVTGDNHLSWDARAAALHGHFGEVADNRLEEWLQSVYPEDLDAAEAHFFTCICSTGPCSQVYRVQTPEGDVRYLRSAGASYRNADGTTRTTGIVWDITSDMMVNQTLRSAKEDSDIKNAELELALEELSNREQELEELSSRLDLALASYNCGIWESNLETGKEIWDARMCQLYNVPYTDGVIASDKWISLIHPDDRPRAEEIRPKFPRGDQNSLTVRVPLPDGSIRYVRSFGKSHVMRDGARKIVGIAFDATEDMRMTQEIEAAKHEAEAKNIELELALDELSNREQDLEELSSRLDLALASYNCGIWEATPQDRTEVWDARMCQLYGIASTGRTVTNEQWLAMVHPDDREMALHISPNLPVSMKEPLTVRVPQPDGSIRYVRSFGKAHSMRDGTVKIVGIAFDVTQDMRLTQQLQIAKRDAEAKNVELELAKQSIEHNALHDPLTLLGNRRKLDLELDALSRDSQSSRLSATILHLDLDRFKQINDTLGHAAGDAMLTHTATILRNVVGAGAVVARIGGDEFVILLRHTADTAEVSELANRIISEFRQPMDFDGFSCRCGVSIGIAQANGMRIDARRLLINADIALYRAKAEGRNRFEFFTQNLQAEIITHKRTADELLSAIENGEFTAWYQPQFCADSREMVGVEALVRWNHPYRGIVAPDAFLPIAEDLNVSAVIDQIVLETVLKDQMRWAAAGISVPRVSVNVSSKRLHDESLVSTLETLSITPGRIAFELVESIFLDESEDIVTHNLERIKALGIDIEIDDFGTGHTSIVSLLKLKPKRLKIDRQLVMPIITSPQERSLVRSIIEIAKSLGVETVAEGVETMEHAALLRNLGCDLLQGYAFARPLPFADFVDGARNGFRKVA
ncbi:bifunctional diguanylate cyclase/phosphodiesterase [Affinirhizobium pseudoryzae]|uniref:bifunctional diguanylate cyclase/phosphodiesterase n=1 Tax=Allorhizobium pseudoryzae TaxID=379684 RepID=UPI0013E9AF95|nr:EAL domain-containing protein [Allorhizobium pseudoryzae]